MYIYLIPDIERRLKRFFDREGDNYRIKKRYVPELH